MLHRHRRYRRAGFTRHKGMSTSCKIALSRIEKAYVRGRITSNEAMGAYNEIVRWCPRRKRR